MPLFSCSGTAFRSVAEAKALPLPHPLRCGLLALVVCAAWMPSLRAEIEFVGILVTSQSTRFALTDTSIGKTDWVGAGQKFSGYTVGAYDRKEDVLTLTRDGADLRVRLKDDARIQAARFELTGSITFGADEKIEVERATLLFDQENVFPLRDGITYRITPTRDDSGNIRYAIAVERILADNKKERLSAPTITTLPGHPFKIQVGELGFAFLPR
jgi:hypothetical protein